MKKRVVVTGMGLVSCFGSNVDHFYEQLLAGKSGITPIDRFPCQNYPTRFAGAVNCFDGEGYIDKKQGRRMDPFLRYAIVAGKKALENSNLLGKGSALLNKSRCGIIIGSGMGGLESFSDAVNALIGEGYRRVSPFFIPYVITNMGGALLAIDLGFTGPNYSISTACATSNFSIHSAAEHIRSGEVDLMLCGGTEAPVTPISLAGFSVMKALSERNEEPQKASRPWDKKRDGFVIGEGAGVLLLEELSHALKRKAPIYAEYLGGSMCCDAHHITNPREDGSGVAQCIELALENAQIKRNAINYINAHATSTKLGDYSEILGIRTVFGNDLKKISINATKSMIGHPLGAAGGIEAIVTIQAINTHKLHPTINLEEPEEELEGIDCILNVAKEKKVSAALSNSFGFGGHNSTLIFSPYLPAGPSA